MARVTPWKQAIESELDKVAAIVQAHTLNAVIEFDYEKFLFRIGLRSMCSSAARIDIEAKVRGLTDLGVNFADLPEYLFTLHFDVVPVAVRPPDLESAVVNLVVELAQLRALHKAYHGLSEASRRVDYVASFALGGFVGMDSVTVHARNGRPLSPRLVSSLQAKYHLLPSLTWTIRGRTPERRLHDWLLSLPLGANVLLFDTTFSGNGIRTIEKSVRKLLRTASVPFRRIQILGVTDGSSFEDGIPRAISARVSVGGKHMAAGVKYLKVPKLLSEDRQDIIGYASLRAEGAMKGGWVPAVVRVINKKGKLVDVRGTDHLADVFSKLIGAPPRDHPLSDPELYAYEALRTVVHHLASKEKQHLTRALVKRRVSSAEFEVEKGAIIKHSEGLMKHYVKIFDLAAAAQHPSKQRK